MMPGAPTVTVVDLDAAGNLTEPATGTPVPPQAVPGFLDRHLHVRRGTTDIFVFVHGWRTAPHRAQATAGRLANLIETTYAGNRGRYPGLAPFAPQHIAIRWPAESNPFPAGYRRIRDRAYAMTDRGHAATVVGQLLGYLNAERRRPGAPVLATSSGQYLHCVGHSFGGRLLGKAIIRAADPPPPTLAWPWRHEDYPYTLDTLAIFQMAARPTIFCEDLRDLLTRAPINGPVALTFSKHDRALRFWHPLTERRRKGVGCVGASCPAEQIGAVTLRAPGEQYTKDELRHRILNVNASRCYRAGRYFLPQGAHSDYLHAESAHLLLSLAAGAR